MSDSEGFSVDPAILQQLNVKTQKFQHRYIFDQATK
jgi:hypothetical protein